MERQIVRNLMRNRLHASVNIAGLAGGFAVAILVALFIRDEQSYDQIWPGHETPPVSRRISHTPRSLPQGRSSP